MNIKIVAIGLFLIVAVSSLYFFYGGFLFLQNKNINQGEKNSSQILQTSVSLENKKNNFNNIQNIIRWVGNRLDNQKDITDLTGAENNDSESKKIIEDLWRQTEGISQELNADSLKKTNSSQELSFQAPEIKNNINPRNLENLDYSISEIKKIGAEQNVSNENLIAVEKAIREIAATSTDLTAEFYKNANIKYINEESGGFFKKIFLALKSMFGVNFIKTSDAALLAPFGGTTLLAVPCTCSAGVWLVTLKPLPPTYATLLSYISGTQLFLSYIPVPYPKREFLGFYVPGVQACYFYVGITCVPAPNWGMMTSFLGSSI